MLFGKVATIFCVCNQPNLSEGTFPGKDCCILIWILSSLSEAILPGKCYHNLIWIQSSLSEALFPGKGCPILFVRAQSNLFEGIFPGKGCHIIILDFIQ